MFIMKALNKTTELFFNQHIFSNQFIFKFHTFVYLQNIPCRLLHSELVLISYFIQLKVKFNIPVFYV